MYGDSIFARSCLLARRLVEDGVRVVSVYYNQRQRQPTLGHALQSRGTPRKLCADGDQAGAALISDLKRAGAR